MDLDILDPDWSLAQKHGKSCIPGKPRQCIVQHLQSIKVDKFCPCCLNMIQKQVVPLYQNSKQLQFLGFGFPLFFIFIKYCIILLLIHTTSYSISSLFQAVQSSRDICSDATLVHKLVNGMEGRCTSWLIWFIRTETVLKPVQIILRLSSFAIQLFTLVYIRDMISKTNDYYEQRTTSLSDYSLLIKNMPESKGILKTIDSFIKNEFGQIIIKDIILLNEMVLYYELKQKKKDCLQKLKYRYNTQKQQIQKIKEQITQIKLKMQNQQKRIISIIQKDQMTSQKAILIVQTSSMKEKIIKNFKQIQKYKVQQYFGENSNQIIIVNAPQPRQIIWQNINYPKQKKLIRSIIGWSLTVIFIAIITGIFYFILRQKSIAVEHILQRVRNGIYVSNSLQTETNMLIITVLAMLLILFFNKFILSIVLHFFTDLQKHEIGSDYEFSFMLKYCFGLFFTTALMTLLVQGISFRNIYTQDYGVAEEQSIMLFFNALLVPIIWFINPWNIYHKIDIYFNKGRKNMTQREANKLMQNPKFSLGKQYAQLIQSIWFVYLYSSLIPGGAPLMVLGFCFYYWVAKYNLLRRNSINQNINGQLSKKTLKLIDASLLLRGIGDFIFDIQIRDGANWQSILCIVVGFIYLLLPIDNLLGYLHNQHFRSQQKSYSQVKSKFIQNYRTLNPLYENSKTKISKVQQFLKLKQIKLQIKIKNKTNESEQNLSKQYNYFIKNKQIDQNNTNILIISNKNMGIQN